MIKVLFFAQVRELIGISKLNVKKENYSDIASLRKALINRGNRWKIALNLDKLLVAVNQKLVPMNYILHDGDEVAFFPPVTGG